MPTRGHGSVPLGVGGATVTAAERHIDAFGHIRRRTRHGISRSSATSDNEAIERAGERASRVARTKINALDASESHRDARARSRG